MNFAVPRDHSEKRNTLRRRNQSTSGDYLQNCIIKISSNTEESPGDLRKFAVTQTPVKDHQLMLVGKIRKW